MQRYPANTALPAGATIVVFLAPGQAVEADAVAVGGSEAYVATETVIGTFLGKTLYRKVLTFATGPATAGDNRQVAHSIGTYTHIVRLYGELYRSSNGTRIPVPYVHTDAQFGILAFADDTNVELRTSGGDYTAFTGYMVIEYCKS